MSVHHRASPSKLGRIHDCPGSMLLCEQAQAAGTAQEGGADAAAGTLKHERTLPGAKIDDLPAADQEEILYAVGEMNAFFDGGEVYRELFLAVNNADGTELTHGTADAVAVFEDKIRIVDFKFGRGEFDAEHVAWQMKGYAAGAMQQFGGNGEFVECMVIHVPETQKYTATFEFLADLVDDIRETIYRASQPDAPRNPSAAACRYCAAKLICPEFRAQVVESPLVKVEPAALTSATLPAALELARRLEPWCKAVKDYAKAAILAGGTVPGWDVGERRVRRCEDFAAAWQRVGDRVGRWEFEDACSLSVAKLEEAYVRAMTAATGGTLKAAKESFAREMDGVVEWDVSKVLKRKG